MKKKTVLCFILLAVIMLISSCSPAPLRPIKNPDGYIHVYGRPGLVNKMFDRFIELHPDFRYEIFFMPSSLTGTGGVGLDSLLAEGNVDIYLAEDSDVLQCSKGALSAYALPYEELGIDVDTGVEKAAIFPYIADIGTRPSDGKVVALSYESTGCAFVYRRSVAKDIWGTDDPAVVKTKIGPGWDKFFKATEELKEKGYAVEFIHPAGYGGKSWISGGKLYISPEREAYLDYAKEKADANETILFGMLGPGLTATYILPRTAEAREYAGDWAVCDPPVGYYEDGTWVLANKALENDPEKKAAVAEFIEWMTLDCTEQGFQYYLAGGKFISDIDGAGLKGVAASRTVMGMSDGKLGFLGGQDLFDAYISAGELIDCENITEYDAAIDSFWRKHVSEYANGECTREEAIAAFKQEVKEQLGIDTL